MDPITHTLAGATLARAGLDRRTPLATAALLLGANAADLDIFTAFGEANATLACRRGWTHGPLAMLALPFVIAGLLLVWDRYVRRRRSPTAVPAEGMALLQLAAIGVLSHPALDWLNTYGIRLLMPFSDTWFRGDSLFIIDPWLWLVFGVGLIVVRRMRATSVSPWRFARISGTVALAYIVAMVALSVAGKRSGWKAAESAGISGITEVLYSPRPATPLKADLVVRTADAYHPGSLAWELSGARVTFTGIAIPRGNWNTSIVQRAREMPGARNYLVWSQFPFVRLEVNGADTTVFFGDARYRGGPAGSLSGMSVTLPRTN
ncbi:MAG: metal-dependent hydrolase [Gemmatimonadaceae bacterium]